MKTFLQIATIAIAMSLAACSTQFRETQVEIESEIVNEILNSFSSEASSLGSEGASLFNSLLDDPNTIVYFAHATNEKESTMGAPYSVVGFPQLEDLDPTLKGNSDLDLENATVAFLVNTNPSQGEAEFMLAYELRLKDSNTVVRKVLWGESAVFTNNSFEVSFYNGSHSFTLQTYDIVQGELDFKSVIQLRVFSSEGAYVGKFSTLLGFGIKN